MQSAFGMNLSILGRPRVIDAGDTLGLSKIEYVNGVVYLVLVSMLVLLLRIFSYISATSIAFEIDLGFTNLALVLGLCIPTTK